MRIPLVSVALMLALVVARPAIAYDDTVALSATPKAVQAAINARIAGGKLDAIESSKENGEVTFDVDWVDKNGKDCSFTVADDGTILSEEVELADVPAPVQRAIKEQATGFELESLEKSVDDPANISYSVEVSKDGKSKWFTVAADGSLSSKEIALADAPAAVQAIVKQKSAGGEIESVEQNFEDGITFDITLSSGGVESSFLVSLTGAIVSEQMDMATLPEGVKTTIREHIGNGKVLRVDRNLAEKRSNVFPFEVHGRKDGKPFDFSVGPRGRFLGMD